ncbi:hypothetical protein ACJ7K1_07865 [Paenibacillus elgii]|uniref:DUF7674 family protein n=1 Tax=Paenibacillus elgii TaxID=189691 RepID=UPI002D7DF825|nr:hypothetical protein Elgi_04580 [Paenibacillus elgii]
MDYEELINYLLVQFPSLKEEYIENDHIHGLPHCVYETILVPEIEVWCKTKNDHNLVKLGNFLEELLLSDDTKIKEVVNVSVLEPIVLGSKDIIPYLSRHLYGVTLQELIYWQKRYSINDN